MVKWQINLYSNKNSTQLKSFQKLEQPFGFSKDTTVANSEAGKKKQLIENKLFEVATASKSQIFMTVFMFWMMGNNISIFMLFAIFQALMSCVGGLMKMNKVFQPYEHMVSDLTKYKLMYFGINLVLLGIIIYKLSVMGLLPVSPTDYIDLIPLYQAREVMVYSQF